jgi:ankyrin repeat protein
MSKARAQRPIGVWEELVKSFSTEHFGATVKQKLQEDASVAHMQDTYGITLLHYAAAKGDRATCELLLAADANKHARNSLGDTPAQDAKRMGHADLVGLLSN